jgi:hypothetical protein
MKNSFSLRSLLVVCAVMVLMSCGDPLIRIGQQLSGSLTSKDNFWVGHDPYTGQVTDAGYSDDYQVQATEGESYTVTLWTSTGNGSFEDNEGGRFYWPNGSSGPSFSPSSGTSTVTWIPAKTGMNAVDVYCFEGEEPIDYTVLITQQ